MKFWMVNTTALICVTLSACASPAKPEAMVPAMMQFENPYPHSVRVAALGGKETNPMWTSQVASDDFLQALVTCLQNTRLFATVVDGAQGGDYLLEVMISDLEQPLFGFEMTVSMTARWQLTDLATGEVVYEETLGSAYSATMGDAFSGVARLRIANEGAARANIQEGVMRLSKVEFTPPLGTGLD